MKQKNAQHKGSCAGHSLFAMNANTLHTKCKLKHLFVPHRSGFSLTLGSFVDEFHSNGEHLIWTFGRLECQSHSHDRMLLPMHLNLYIYSKNECFVSRQVAKYITPQFHHGFYFIITLNCANDDKNEYILIYLGRKRWPSGAFWAGREQAREWEIDKERGRERDAKNFSICYFLAI